MREGMKKGVGLTLMLFVLLFFVPSRAYAADNLQWRYDGVVFGPTDAQPNYPIDPNNRQWVIVNAPDKFSAAVYAVGGNPLDLTSDQKALLSNASSGGDFYTFSQLFQNLGGSFDYPDYMTSGAFASVNKRTYKEYAEYYGEDYVYVAAFTPAQKNGAASDYSLILNGGGSGSGAGNKYTLSKDMSYTYLGNYINSYDFKIPLNGTGIRLDSAPLTCDVVVPDGLKSKIDSWLSSGKNVIIYIDGTNNPSYPNPRLKVMTFSSNTTLGTVTDTWNNTYLSINSTGGSATFYGEGCQADVSSAVGVPSLVYTYTSYSNVSFGGSVPMYLHLRDLNDARRFQYFGGYQLMLYSDGTASTPQVPESNWPDDDYVAPTPPDLPEPQTPTLDQQPTQPTPQPDGSYPSYTVVTVNNFTADIQGILDAMDEHCTHLQNAIWWNFNQFWQKISSKMTNDFSTMRTFLSQQFGWIVDSIDKMFESLNDYLEDLAEWLRDELNYTISGSSYDDNTLLSWLKRIYYKLGNGNVSTKPVDPVSNPDGVGDWISQLLANLFTALDDLAGGLLTSLATLIGGLVTKFPFSIPWDVAAILGLLVATPQAPSFDVPVYVFNGIQLEQVGTYEIDLDTWTPYLTGIHMMIKVSFILFLLLKTKDFMSIMEKAVGLGA